MVTFDQWRGDWLHQSWLHLPNLKHLSRTGWDVRRCYTSSPQCIPARASWLTGLTPGQLGVTKNMHYTVPSNSPSFARDLRDQHGFYNVLVGKTHWTPHVKGADLRDNMSLMRDLGFDHVREIAGPRALAEVSCELTDLWQDSGLLEKYQSDIQYRYLNGCVHTVRPSVLPIHLYPDLWLTKVALEELSRMPYDRPWLLWVNYPGPHEPFDVPLSWRGHHGDIPPPESRPDDSEQLQLLAPAGSELARKLDRWPDGIPTEAVRALRSDYADHLHLLDTQLGILLQRLDMRSDQPNTAVTVCSDHGELLGDWGLLLKGCFLEGAIRSLFVHSPPDKRRFPRRLWQPYYRAYGLTKCLWDAATAVANPHKSFGTLLRSQDRNVLIEFGKEQINIQ